MLETSRQERRPGVRGDGNVCPSPVAIDRNVRRLWNLYSGNDAGTINDRRALDPCLGLQVMMPVLPEATLMSTKPPLEKAASVAELAT